MKLLYSELYLKKPWIMQTINIILFLYLCIYRKTNHTMITQKAEKKIDYKHLLGIAENYDLVIGN